MSKVFMDFGHTVYIYDTDKKALIRNRVESNNFDRYNVEEDSLSTKNLMFLEELKDLIYSKGQEDRSREIGRLLGVKS